MIGDKYEAVDDPACYPGSDVHLNLPDLRNAEAPGAASVEQVGLRSLQSPPEGEFDPAHYRALHRHLFQDVYEWAGEYRTIRTAKEHTVYMTDYIETQMDAAFQSLATNCPCPVPTRTNSSLPPQISWGF